MLLQHKTKQKKNWFKNYKWLCKHCFSVDTRPLTHEKTEYWLNEQGCKDSGSHENYALQIMYAYLPLYTHSGCQGHDFLDTEKCPTPNQ